jgi:hypothetical protein
MGRSPRLWVVLVVLAVAVTLFAQSSLTNFGLSDTEVKSHVVSAMVDGYFPFYPNRKTFNAASGSVRAAFVRNVLTVIKSYTESPAFQSAYAKQRAEAKPTQEAAAKGSPDISTPRTLPSSSKASTR